MNRPKGMLQVLFERGYIDVNLVTKPSKMCYSKEGKKSDIDPNSGELKEEARQYNLSYLLSNCSDFKTQKTDVEQLCDEINHNINSNTSILFSPKFHCELAGEGIEYSWGV